MVTQKKLSRFSPAYLASRHAGVIAMLTAFGLLVGMAWRSLVQPTRYHAETEIGVSVDPASSAASFDWNAKHVEWREILQERRYQGLLEGNLRHALKLAVTQNMPLDTASLSERLSQFNQGVVYSASLFRHSLAARLGPSVEITLDDLAANLDFQSLAAIISDLDPAPGVENWDFTFFNDTPIIAARDSLIVEPGPRDRYFRVFYRLHAFLRAGREAASPAEAWKSAVDALRDRLERETKFAGGGGFGHTAKRELIREIGSIPALAANGLYFGNLWLVGQGEYREDETLWRNRWMSGISLELDRDGSATGLLDVSMDMELYPLAFPRDTVLTRLSPMTLATLLSFLAAREERSEPVIVVAPTVPPVAEVGEARPAAVPAPAPAVSTVYQDVVDEAAAKKRGDRIAELEAAASKAGMGRNAAVRRLETARANEARLSREAVAARARVDRYQERLDETALAAARDLSPRVPPETAALFAKRDDLLRRLTELLEYCTEEHPFVKEIRRELEAAEAMLAMHKPDPSANREAEIRAMRLASLKLEYEAAEEAAEGLEERLRMQGEAVACLLEEVANLDRDLNRKEVELARARETPVPMMRREVSIPAPLVTPPPAEPVVVAVAPSPPVAVARARLAFTSMPQKILQRAFPPPWTVPLCAAAAGLALGLLLMLLRELFASRLDSPGEAARLIRLPVLAALPAYDMKSVRAAAATMKGELARSFTGQLLFTPAQIDLIEPPALARRGKIHPARKRMRIVPWLFALVFLALAALLYYKSLTGFARPETAFSGELLLPAETVRMWADESDVDEEWGNLP